VEERNWEGGLVDGVVLLGRYVEMSDMGEAGGCKCAIALALGVW
jgi:hypothetical protein